MRHRERARAASRRVVCGARRRGVRWPRKQCQRLENERSGDAWDGGWGVTAGSVPGRRAGAPRLTGGDHQLTLASAGHLAPLLIDDERHGELAAVATGVPIGIAREAP